MSINPLDGKLRRGEARLLSGSKFPKTPGLDFAGVVEQVGQGVSGFDSVLALSARLPFSQARVLLKPRGVYVDFEPGPTKLVGAALQNPFRSQQHRFVITRSSTAALEALGRQLDAGALRPGSTRVFPLSEYRRAFELAEKGGLVGKVVIQLQ